MRKIKDIQERFWSKVEKTTVDGCWNWTAALQANGYGYFHISAKEGHIAAHRFSYEKENGKIPNGMLVCHKCDNTKCVRPSHLFLGTHKENAIDREKKGRGAHGNMKLTIEEVRQIKSSKLSQISIAKKYGVSRRTIASIQYGETWKQVPGPLNEGVINYPCDICAEPAMRSIFIDMNFQYRKISDKLCLRCDRALKMFSNNITYLQNAISFLQTSNGKQTLEPSFQAACLDVRRTTAPV